MGARMQWAVTNNVVQRELKYYWEEAKKKQTGLKNELGI